MSDENLTTLSDQQAQQRLSAEDTTEPVQALPVDAYVPETGTVNFEDEPETGREVEGLTESLPYVPKNMRFILSTLGGTENPLVRLVIRPKLHFVVNLFADTLHDDLSEKVQYVNGDEKFNLVQPLSKHNVKSGRTGYLRDRLRAFCSNLEAIANSYETVVLTGDSATLPVEAIMAEYTHNAENTLFAGLPRVNDIPVLPWTLSVNEDGSVNEEYAVPFSEMLRLSFMLGVTTSTLEVDDTNITSIDVDLNAIVHLRIPCLIREDQARFDKNLSTHFKYLENCGIASNLPTTISAAFSVKDIAYSQPVNNAFNWIVDTDSSASVLSFRDVAEGEDIFGIQNFTSEEYEQNLFNGGDFIVTFTLNNEEQ